MDNEQLQKFCCESDIRPYAHNPWRTPFGIVATNGHVLVIVPDDGRQLESMPTDLANLEKPLALPAGESWIPMASIELPEMNPCKACDGRGRIVTIRCDDCGGEGMHYIGRHEYACKECDGDGTSHEPAPPDAKVSEYCDRCLGSGNREQPVEVLPGRHFQRRYLSILQTLPGCELSPNSAGSARFRFDGGEGVLMGIRV